MASGILHGLKERGIRAEDIEVGLDRAQTIDPISGTGDLTVLQTDHGTSISRESGFRQEPYRPGIITDAGPNGEADKTAPMYWVKLAMQPGGDFNTALSLQPSEFGQFYIVPVTNIKESAGGPRLLKKDTWVNVFIWSDLDGIYRFYIDTSPGMTPKPGKLATAWAHGDTTVSLTPVVGFFDSTATGEPNVTVRIHTPAIAPPSLQANVGDILAYLSFQDAPSGTTVNILVSPPILSGPTAQYQVLTPIDASLIPGWFFPRFHS